MTIQIINKVDRDHLDQVKAEMQVLGAPSIRAFWSSELDCWIAIEGSHRLTAALELGLTPTIVEVDPETQIKDVDGLDWDFTIDGVDPADSTDTLAYWGIPEYTWVGRYLHFDWWGKSDCSYAKEPEGFVYTAISYARVTSPYGKYPSTFWAILNDIPQNILDNATGPELVAYIDQYALDNATGPELVAYIDQYAHTPLNTNNNTMTNANNTPVNTLHNDVDAANDRHVAMLERIGHVDGRYTQGIEDITMIYINDILEACADYCYSVDKPYAETYVVDYLESQLGTTTYPELVSADNLVAHLDTYAKNAER